MDDDGIRALVKRLARPDGAGGAVIERAAIMAAGPQTAAILAWIDAHGGQPEVAGTAASTQGLHGKRESLGVGGGQATPRRYVLPLDVLG